MKKIIFILLLILLAIKYLTAQTVIFKNTTYTSPLSFQSYIDTLIIDNCIFQNFNGEAIRFEGLNYVEIKNSSFINISNTISTRAVICGKKANFVKLTKLNFNNIGGTAIRFPTDGETSRLKKLGSITIDSVYINGISDTGGLESNGIRVFLTDTLRIRNSVLKNIDNNALSLGRNSSGQTQIDQRINYCEIHQNYIDSILGNGIVASENTGRSYIYQNIISNIATDGIGMLPNEGEHGIYWQAPGAHIYKNHIYNIFDGLVSGNTGNGISLRTNTRVYQNEVSNCTRNGISYWNDHPGSSLLEITNNLIFETGLCGIYVNGSGTNPDKPDSVLILHNTVRNRYNNGLVFQYSPIALNNLDSYNLVAGNLLLFDNVSDTSDFIQFLGTTPSQNISNNYYGDLLCFENTSLADYHLVSSCQAINVVPPTTTNISVDKDNKPRLPPFDAGCYEYSQPINFEERNDYRIDVYPNPTHGMLQVSFEENTEYILVLYDLYGRIIAETSLFQNGISEIDMSVYMNGIYILELRNCRNVFRTKIIKISL